MVVKLASDDPTSRATGVGLGAYFARDHLLPRARATRIGGPAGAVPRWPTTTTPRAGSRSCSRTSPTPSRAIRSPAARASRRAIAMRRAGARSTRPVLGDLALGAAAWLNQPNPLNQALLAQLLPGVPRALRRADRARARRGAASASSTSPTPGPTTGARRSASSTATTGSTTCCSPATTLHGRRLADGVVGPGDARRLLLPRRRALGRGPPRARARRCVRDYHDELLARGVTGLRAGSTCWEEYRRQLLPRAR